MIIRISMYIYQPSTSKTPRQHKHTNQTMTIRVLDMCVWSYTVLRYVTYNISRWSWRRERVMSRHCNFILHFFFVTCEITVYIHILSLVVCCRCCRLSTFCCCYHIITKTDEIRCLYTLSWICTTRTYILHSTFHLIFITFSYFSDVCSVLCLYVYVCV